MKSIGNLNKKIARIIEKHYLFLSNNRESYTLEVPVKFRTKHFLAEI